MHPEIALALTHARVADLHRLRGPVPAYDRPPRRRVRRRLGWFLVDLGLRLATPGAA